MGVQKVNKLGVKLVKKGVQKVDGGGVKLEGRGCEKQSRRAVGPRGPAPRLARLLAAGCTRLAQLARA